jgi:hypothetical protein
LEEEIYLCEPKGFKSGDSRAVWRLLKTFYSLKQSGRCWNEKFEELSFTRCISDYSFYHRHTEDVVTMLAVHVDDMIITCSTVEGMVVVKKELQSKFDMQEEGEVKWMLGIEILRNRPARSISITHNDSTSQTYLTVSAWQTVPLCTPRW